MSVKKVEQYKEYKKNKKEILRKEKFMRRLEYTLIGAVCALFIGWFGWSIYHNATASKTDSASTTVTATAVNFTEFDTYYNGLTLTY